MDLDENYQVLEAIIHQAEHLHNFYQALQNEGFEEEAAVIITIAYMNKMMETAMQRRWWEFWK